MGDALSFTFTGKVDGQTMSGELDMGEYLKANWTARRHQYGPRQLPQQLAGKPA